MRLTSGHTSEDFPHYISSESSWLRHKEVSEKSPMLLPTGKCVSGKFIYIVSAAIAMAAAAVAILHGHKNQNCVSLVVQWDPKQWFSKKPTRPSVPDWYC